MIVGSNTDFPFVSPQAIVERRRPIISKKPYNNTMK